MSEQIEIDNSNKNDRILCDGIKSGYNDAFDTLVKKHEGIIRFYIDSFTAGVSKKIKAEKEDLFQECLIVLYRAAVKYDESHNVKFATFLGVCVRNFLISYYRAQNKKILTEVIDIDKIPETAQTSDFYNLTGAKLSMDTLDSAMATLTAFERSVFDRYIFEDRSYREIAIELGRNIKSVDNALKRAKAKIRSACT